MGLPDPFLVAQSAAGSEEAGSARAVDANAAVASSSSVSSGFPEREGSHANVQSSDYASSLSVGSAVENASNAPIYKGSEFSSAESHGSSAQRDIPANQDPANLDSNNPYEGNRTNPPEGRNFFTVKSLLMMSSGHQLLMSGSSERRLLPAPEAVESHTKGARSQSLHDVYPPDAIPLLIPRRRSPSRSPAHSRSRSRSRSPCNSPKGPRPTSIPRHVHSAGNLEDLLMAATSHVLIGQKAGMSSSNNRRTFKWSPSTSRSPSLSPKGSLPASPLAPPQPFKVPYIEHMEDLPISQSPPSTSNVSSNDSSKTAGGSAARFSSPGRLSPGRKARVGRRGRSESPDRLAGALMTPFAAARDGKLEALRKLLPPGAADSPNGLGFTCLHIAASHGRVAAVEWLIRAAGADVNRRSVEQGWTPLHLACRAGHAACAEALLAAGADTRAADARGRTPLHLACTHPAVHCVAVLVRHARAAAGATRTEEGPDIDSPAPSVGAYGSVGPAGSAGPNGSVGSAGGLGSYHGDMKGGSTTAGGGQGDVTEGKGTRDVTGGLVGDADDDRWTCVHFAARCNSPEVLELVLAAGADPDARDADGWTALHNCARNGQKRCAEALLRHRADPRATTRGGAETPLHIACRRSKVKLIALLLDAARADGVLAEALLARDRCGHTAEMACAGDYVRDLFRESLVAWTRQNDPQLARMAEALATKPGGVGGGGGYHGAVGGVSSYSYLNSAGRAEMGSVSSQVSEVAVGMVGGCVPSRFCAVM